MYSNGVEVVLGSGIVETRGGRSITKINQTFSGESSVEVELKPPANEKVYMCCLDRFD